MMTGTGEKEKVTLLTLSKQIQTTIFHRKTINLSLKDKRLHARYLLVLGSEGVGKTFLINRFLDRKEDHPRAKTFALEYTFGRRGGKSLQKDVAHIWELGGGTRLLSLTQPVLQSSAQLYGLKNITVILMLDLSLPNKLWNTLETTIDYLIEAVYQTTSTKFPNFIKEMEMKSWARNNIKINPDKELLEPFPLPIIILCGKYDIFEEFDPDVKIQMCHVLRCTALVLGATLQFYSSKDVTLIKKAKDLMLSHGLGLRVSRSISTDYSKPMIVPAGTDAFQYIFTDINMPTKGHIPIYCTWKKQYAKHFPPDPEEEVDNAAEQRRALRFREPLIDELKILRNQDLKAEWSVLKKKAIAASPIHYRYHF